MRLDGRRRGSALLIVLGMLAFMIVSAVAFSAYMRVSRLPSSYLRRTTATRQLVKGALARAIDEIDLAVANNPHPGLGTEAAQGYNRNVWKSRVYIGTNQLMSAQTALEETVPVLTLEGLAYIPPPLVNDARFYSRRSQAAKWHTFGFDAGRYAFCAIDVSDYLDVNRLAADRARFSAANSRVSLAYLFEPYGHRSPGSGAAEWDSWMKEFRTEDDESLGFTYAAKVPLVSLADFNLALGEDGRGGMSSPFCKFVNSSGGTGFNTFSGQSEEEQVKKMTFVTDSWFPETERSLAEAKENSGYDEIYDLSSGDCQPFEYNFLNGPGGPSANKMTTIMHIIASAAKAKTRLLDSMPALGLVALYDYLDIDKVPVTLAAPTLERTPMLCGLKPNFNSTGFAVRQESTGVCLDENCSTAADPRSKTGQTRTVYQKTICTIDPAQFTSGLAGGIEALFAYPFAHEDSVNDTFSVDGRVSVFFSLDDDPIKLRTGNAANSEVLHLNSKNFQNETPGLNANGVVNIPIVPIQNRRFGKANPTQEKDQVEKIPLQTRGALSIGPTLQTHPLMEVTVKWTQTWDSMSLSYDNQTQPANAQVHKAHCGVPPLKSNGVPDERFTNDTQFKALLDSGGKKASINVATWVRIFDKNGKTVDLVPAHVSDDRTFNGLANTAVPNVNALSGSPGPLMKFSTGASFEYSLSGMSAAATAQPFVMDPVAVTVDDPRFNHAPESWRIPSDTSLEPQSWIDGNGSESRNGDIFMATSDQGYMQSIYELAFLPRFSNLESVGANGPVTGDYNNPDDGRTSLGQGNPANEAMMWRSYRPYGSNSDDFEGLGFTSAGTGYKINPYTDSTNIMMAAFANTPVDWRMASTNNQDVVIEGLGAAQFNQKFAWNEYGASDSRFTYSDLEGIAGAFMGAISSDRANDTSLESAGPHTLLKNWRDAWMSLWNQSDSGRFGSYELRDTELWSVDRKFLYGYWSDCFAVKQQLFLVFVRAEPLMMGGGALSSIPPQLGARAVALVWRDPAKTTDNTSGKNGYPHRTRVLFYKQLD